MKTFLKTSLSLLLLLAASEYSVAKDWRGITPLRSTRADVVRLFNQCSDQREACAFTLGNDKVYILFSGGVTDDYSECARRLPSETVMFIDVELKATPKIKSLNLDKKKFRTFNPAEPYKMDLKGYWNESDGLLINTLRGEVIQIDYLAAVADKSRCLSFYEEPESWGRGFAKRPDANIQIEWQFSEEEIKSETELGEATIQWRSFLRVVETSEGFLFYPLHNLFHWLPFSAFESPDCIEKVRKLLRENNIPLLGQRSNKRLQRTRLSDAVDE